MKKSEALRIIQEYHELRDKEISRWMDEQVMNVLPLEIRAKRQEKDFDPESEFAKESQTYLAQRGFRFMFNETMHDVVFLKGNEIQQRFMMIKNQDVLKAEKLLHDQMAKAAESVCNIVEGMFQNRDPKNDKAN